MPGGLKKIKGEWGLNREPDLFAALIVEGRHLSASLADFES